MNYLLIYRTLVLNQPFQIIPSNLLLKSDYPHVRDNLTTRNFDEQSKQIYKSVKKLSSIEKSKINSS